MIKMPHDYNGPLYQDADAFLEWIVRDCAAVVAQESCGEDKPYDFIQGWEAALDLAEQAILKRYGLKEKI